MRRSLIILQYPRVMLADVLYKQTDKESYESGTLKGIIDKDIERYIGKSDKNQSDKRKLNELLLNNLAFRSQFYFRLNQSPKLGKSILKTVSKVLLSPLPCLQIGINKTGYVGGGLKIMHISGCVISAHKIGNNLTVYQGVTIGDSLYISQEGYKNPVIGNDVTIYANAVVAGGITIGDNVTIGAGSVVLKDVPPDCVVVGNPAKIIRQNGQKTDIML